MVTGFQDWDVPVNINAQTLGEIINRPKYGTCALGSAVAALSNDTAVDILTISGKGQVYGGLIGCFGDSSSRDSVVTIRIDGPGIETIAYSSAISINQTRPHNHALYLSFYDDIDFKYYFSISRELTFETSYVVNVKRQPGVFTQFVASVLYALI